MRVENLLGVVCEIRDGLGALGDLWFELCVGWLGPRRGRVRAHPVGCWNRDISLLHSRQRTSVSTDLEEDIVIKNTFLEVVRKEPGRPRADSVPS